MFSQTSSSAYASSSKYTLGEPRTECEPAHDDYIPESDIADQYYDSLAENNERTTMNALDVTPPRPGSRLDFNSDEEDGEEEEGRSEPSSVLGSRPLRFEWTKSLFQRIGIHRTSGTDTGSGKARGAQKLPSSVRVSQRYTPSRSPSPNSMSSAPHTPSDLNLIEDISFTFSSDDDEEFSVDATDDETTSDEESDIDLDSLSLSDFDIQDHDIHSGSPNTHAVTADQHVPIPPTLDLDDTPEDSSPLKPKFSYLPSRLSPKSLYRPRPPQPHRHNYEHRGHSRHALLHLKWFWTTREEDWAEYESATHSRPYGGISTSPELPSPSLASRFPRLFRSARNTPPNSTGNENVIPGSPPLLPIPMTVHPRWGDLSGLRDQWCVHMDRYLGSVPMWRIKKSLWTADMEVMSMVHRRRRESQENDDDDEDNESLMRMSMLTGLSDDSDLTLVESDYEGDDRCPSPNQTEDVSGKKGDDDTFYDNEDNGHFEDVNLDEPSSSTFPGPSSATCTVFASSSKTSLASHSPLPAQSANLHAPYSPCCKSRDALKGVGYTWATNWYQKSQLLLHLLCVTNPNSSVESQSASQQGLGIEVRTNVDTKLGRSCVAEDADLPSNKSHTPPPRRRILSA